jgi:hypothetical protein
LLLCAPALLCRRKNKGERLEKRNQYDEDILGTVVFGFLQNLREAGPILKTGSKSAFGAAL